MVGRPPFFVQCFSFSFSGLYRSRAMGWVVYLPSSRKSRFWIVAFWCFQFVRNCEILIIRIIIISKIENRPGRPRWSDDHPIPERFSERTLQACTSHHHGVSLSIYHLVENLDFRFLILGVFGILSNEDSNNSIINDESRDFGVDGRQTTFFRSVFFVQFFRPVQAITRERGGLSTVQSKIAILDCSFLVFSVFQFF